MRALVAPGPERLDDVCSPACRELLQSRFEVLWNDGPELTAADLADRLPGAGVLLTSWVRPRSTSARWRPRPICGRSATRPGR